jgi:hypothetical protein
VNARQRRKQWRRVVKTTRCPRCGGATDIGYGLGMGPGFGSYVWCGSLDDDGDSCGWSFFVRDTGR